MSTIPEPIRQQVRLRAADRCEYCHRPGGLDTYSSQVDHIIATKHGGKTDLSNLAWTCFRCNNFKGSDVASYDDMQGELTPLYHPRRQRWDDHFTLQDGLMIGKTPTGRVTVKLLQMNHPKQVEMRRDLIAAGLW